jgi:hypothetical protein
MTSIIVLYSEIYYEPLCEKYNILLTLNKEPDGELKKYTKHIRITRPSTNEDTINKTYCSYGISNTLSNRITNSSINLMTQEQLDEFTQFILNNNYVINDVVTQHYKNNLYHNNKKVIYAFMLNT